MEVALQRALEESQCEEDACWEGLGEALMLSAAGDCVYPPWSPPLLPKLKAQPEPASTLTSPPADLNQWYE